jgi:2-polyprenyl-3-methyl-5-hydroxy-6-metoxy-1,4-benzoquinol methylase
MSTETIALNQLAAATGYSVGANVSMVEYSFEIAQRHLRGETILELGPAEGVMTKLLVATGKKITVVEAAKTFCQSIAQRFPQVEICNALFEDYQTSSLFDNIILGHVLEHVQDPIDIVRRVRTWLKPGTGRLFAAVPNSRSLHRQAAVMMNMLSQEDALNEADIQHGHRRVFSPESFRNTFLQAGMKIELFGGYWLKPVSNRQIEESWTPDMLNAFMRLGERYPDIAAEIYVVAAA